MRCLLVWLVLVQYFPITARAEVIHGAAEIRKAASQFLGGEVSSTYPDSIAEIQVGAVDERLKLPACSALNFFLAPGSHLWGTGSLRVQCDAPTGWSLYLTYRIHLKGPALVARHPLPSNYTPTEQDLRTDNVEYTLDPGHYPRNPENLHGATLTMPLAKGRPLTVEMLRTKPIIQAGQRVKIVAQGPGFVVSQEGVAQQQAGVGDLIRLKLSSGRYLQGVVQDDGTVSIQP